MRKVTLYLIINLSILSNCLCNNRGNLNKKNNAQLIIVNGSSSKNKSLFKFYSKKYREDIYKILIGKSSTEKSFKTFPIKINLWGNPTDVFNNKDVLLKLSIQPNNKIIIILNVRLHDNFSEEYFQLELIKAILLERMLINHSNEIFGSKNKFISPPQWVTYGLHTIIKKNNLNLHQIKLYKKILSLDNIISPEKILSVNNINSLNFVEFNQFKLSSAALLQSLLNQKEGKTAFQKFLSDLSIDSINNQINILYNNYASIRESKNSLKKYWFLQLSSWSKLKIFNFMNYKETDKLISNAIILKFKKEEIKVNKKRFFIKKNKTSNKVFLPAITVNIHDYKKFVNRKNIKNQLSLSLEKLEEIQFNSFPLCKKIITSYIKVIKSLISNPKVSKSIDLKLEEINFHRKEIKERMKKTEIYLNSAELKNTSNQINIINYDTRKKLNKNIYRRKNEITEFINIKEKEF